MTTLQQIKIITTALKDHKATEIKVYDVRGVSGLTDYFIVATGAAAPHLKALATAVQAATRDASAKAFRTAGDGESGWIAVDFIDIVVHIFSPEARCYYALEKLWEGCEKGAKAKAKAPAKKPAAKKAPAKKKVAPAKKATPKKKAAK